MSDFQTFKYRAYKSSGEYVMGEEKALQSDHVRERLLSRGLTPVEITAASGFWHILNDPIHIGPLFMLPQKVIFYRSMARLMTAGLTLEASLELTMPMFHGRRSAALKEVQLALRKGGALANSLSTEKSGFTEVECQQIAAGEASGHLTTIITQLSEQSSADLTLQNKIRSALIYPALLMVAVLLTLVLMITIVLPNFAPIFAGKEDQLPFLTHLILRLETIFPSLMIGLLFLSGLFFVAWVMVNRKQSWRYHFHTWLSKRRIWQALRLPRYNSILATTLGLGIKSGLGLDRALLLTLNSLNNLKLKEDMAQSVKSVRGGASLNQALTNCAWLSPYITQFVRVGENSGKLGEALLEASDIISTDYSESLEKKVTLLTPLLTLLAGAIVALVVVGVVMGILTINDLAL